ncbi:MAG: hypothetical protein INR63_32050 [Actinomycetospora chiangmaiensis]|nr:hypothetical protein [Actinomycetospora chiangmaiensis]
MTDPVMRIDLNGERVPLTDADLAQFQADAAAVAAAALAGPDCGSLAFWLTALDLWTRQDSSGATVTRTADVQAAVARMVAAGNPLGKLAARQLEYANTVLRADLLKLAPAFGFTLAECDESLWRADRVRQGDLTGVWPLPGA